MHFILMNQLNHQYSGTVHFQKSTSNTPPILPIPFLRFHLLWEYSIVIPLIMLVLRIKIQIIHLNLPLTLFQNHITLQSKQLMIIKWIISLNYFTWTIMMTFGCLYPDASGLTSGLFFLKNLCSINSVVS